MKSQKPGSYSQSVNLNHNPQQKGLPEKEEKRESKYGKEGRRLVQPPRPVVKDFSRTGVFSFAPREGIVVGVDKLQSAKTDKAGNHMKNRTKKYQDRWEIQRERDTLLYRR